MGAQMVKKANTSQTIKAIIAKECGMPIKQVTNSTLFMANKDLPYFVCVDALYTLEHRCNVKLPESDYEQYNTVGDLAHYIVKHQNSQSK